MKHTILNNKDFKKLIYIMKKIGDKVKNKYRSQFESRMGLNLTMRNVNFEYETKVIEYIKPVTNHKYTPDFILPNGIIIEAKGEFKIADRKKHILIKEQNPELDIRFVFQRMNNTISKKSKTTYAKWCEKNGFLYAETFIPQDWIEEKEK